MGNHTSFVILLTREPILELTVTDNANYQKLSNTSDEARADRSMLGLWQRGQRAFVDVRIFNHFALSYRNQSLYSTDFECYGVSEKWIKIIQQYYGGIWSKCFQEF